MKDSLREGSEIVYTDPLKLDMWGVGTVQGIEIGGQAEPKVKILFGNSITIFSQSFSLSDFKKKIDQKEIEDAKSHQWRILERELVNKPLTEAVKEVESFSGDELANLIKLLKERVEGETRLSREQAVVLLGAIGEFLDDEEEPKGIFEFLLEQTKRTIKKRGVPSVSSYGLSIEAQFQREQQKVIAQSLIAAAKVAQKMDEEMQQAVKEVAARCQTSSFKIIKDAGSEALATLQNR